MMKMNNERDGTRGFSKVFIQKLPLMVFDFSWFSVTGISVGTNTDGKKMELGSKRWRIFILSQIWNLVGEDKD